MSIPSFFRIAFFALPLLEIAGFIIVGSMIGIFPTLLLIIATSILGGAMVRGGGLMELKRIQHRIQQGKLPPYQALQAPMILLAGFLLLLPGFITDFVGLLLLIPIVRKLLLFLMLRKGFIKDQKHDDDNHKGPHVIEGEFRRHDEDD